MAEGLALWGGTVTAEPLGGGLTNANFLVRHRGERFVVRVGDDIPRHQVMRFNERAASLAAHAAGLSPRVLHHEPGALVVAFVDGQVLTPETIREEKRLERIVELIRLCHTRMIEHLRGPLLMFWPFHILRDYAATLREGKSRFIPELPGLMKAAATLERRIGPIDVAFCHNDLLAGNLIDDGKRLWLIDWDYAGFNSPLFDLANLASNNGFTPGLERRLLTLYFGRRVEADLMGRFRAMRATSLLREAMWGMVSELHSTLAIDYVTYAKEHLAKF
ncbi:MAG: phosphotransferase family protein, partial [Hyphomicrobiales bacterium]|nr:phosphotransferase family protein [Hyphomicrobiales bacterium]